MELAGCRPPGSKNHPKTKEDGEWPDPALRCEITPRSHVFLFILFTSRFWKTEQIARNAETGPLQATSPVQMRPFHLFFRSNGCGNDFYADRRSVHDHSILSLGDKMACAFYFSESGQNFMEIFPASCGVKSLHAATDNFSTGSQVTPPAWLLHLAPYVDIAK